MMLVLFLARIIHCIPYSPLLYLPNSLIKKNNVTIDHNTNTFTHQTVHQNMVKQYLDANKLEDVKLMMNLEMVNNTMGFNAMGNDKLKAEMDKIGELMAKIDPAYKNMNRNAAGLHSDHQPFMIHGVPVCSPSGSFPVKAYNCYHANCDRFDLIDKDQINNNVRFTAMMLYALANMNELPVKKLNDSETKEFLIKQNLKQELVIGKDWRWDL